MENLFKTKYKSDSFRFSIVIKVFQHKNKRQNKGVWIISFIIYSSSVGEYTDGIASAEMMKLSIVFPLHSFTMRMNVSLIWKSKS